jgi:hypothetical protein
MVNQFFFCFPAFPISNCPGKLRSPSFWRRFPVPRTTKFGGRLTTSYLGMNFRPRASPIGSSAFWNGWAGFLAG